MTESVINPFGEYEEIKKQHRPGQFEPLADNIDLVERRRSSSFNEKSIKPSASLLMKSGLMKKKGIFFYNIRLVQLNVKGILTYYDPKNLEVVRGEIDLKNRNIIVKLTGKAKDYIEIITKDDTYIFKVSTQLIIINLLCRIKIKIKLRSAPG
jgi:hypothetical protein